MPNLTTPIPSRISGNTAEDIRAIKKWGTALIDELTYIFNNLDAGNVSEAASVKAENIDTSNAKITNAQIGNLTADKLRTGQVDTDLVVVKSESGNLSISGNSINISDNSVDRFKAEYNPLTDLFTFALYNNEGQPTVYINSAGNAVFSGRIDSSEIYTSTIIGTDSLSYQSLTGGVFAMTDKQGMKIMQDLNGQRLQKFGVSVGDDGSAYIVLGAGDGNDEVTINGVKYSHGSFIIQKTDTDATMGLVGFPSWISLFEDGEVWISGDKVLVNGRDILKEIDNIKNSLNI